MARARLIKRGSRAKLSGAWRARSHVRALTGEETRRRGTRADRRRFVMSLARRARSRSIPRDAGPGDDEIQAAAAAAVAVATATASRVVDITP